jgi:Na+/citrate or Na+/malate symporter
VTEVLDALQRLSFARFITLILVAVVFAVIVAVLIDVGIENGAIDASALLNDVFIFAAGGGTGGAIVKATARRKWDGRTERRSRRS